MKILLVAPLYHKYYVEILRALEYQGFSVSFFPDENTDASTLFLSKIGVKKKTKFYDLKKFTDLIVNNNFDLIVVIRGERFLDGNWREVLERSEAKKILYQWDSLRNFNYLLFSYLFDSVSTFDRSDALENNYQYLPLFYIDTDFGGDDEKIDLLFVGIWHSDRIEILSRLSKEAEEKGLTYYFRVYYPYYLYLYLIYVKRLKIKSSFFIFKPIPINRMIELYQQSRCIVDISHPNQTGLTMRTIETLGRNKKLITTNAAIKYESFYNEEQIYVMDRKSINLNEEFLRKSFSGNISIKSLEIKNWVKLLLKYE